MRADKKWKIIEDKEDFFHLKFKFMIVHYLQ